MLDWNRKLERMSRSNLSAEAQSAANVADMLEWLKVLHLTLDQEEMVTFHGRLPLITDSKSLYDASMTWISGLWTEEETNSMRGLVLDQSTTVGGGTHQNECQRVIRDLRREVRSKQIFSVSVST